MVCMGNTSDTLIQIHYLSFLQINPLFYMAETKLRFLTDNKVNQMVISHYFFNCISMHKSHMKTKSQVLCATCFSRLYWCCSAFQILENAKVSVFYMLMFIEKGKRALLKINFESWFSFVGVSRFFSS